MALASLNRLLLSSYRPHQVVFILGFAAMLVIDMFWLQGWATFWVMICWSTVFGVHFMVHRAQTVDEHWVYERTVFEVYRPWDTGHIEEIKNSPFGKSIYRTELGRVDEKGDPVEKLAHQDADETKA